MSFDLIAFLKSILPSLEAIAKLTTTTLDDNVVAVVEAIIANPSVEDFIRHLLANDATAHSLSFATEAPPELSGAVEASGIDWAKWIAAIPTILKIVALFAKKG